MIESTRELRSILLKDQLSLLYKSVFTDDFTDLLIELEETNLIQKEGMKKSRRKVSFLMAESFQNIVRHGLKGLEGMEDYFHLRHHDGSFYINSGNLIQQSLIPDLTEKLKLVNSLDKDELKQLHIDVLRSGELSEKGGAGIGLVEMARKTGNKLRYDFRDFSDKLSIFSLGLTLHSPQVEEVGQEQLAGTIKDSTRINELMKNNHWLLVYKGDYSQDAIMPVLGVLEKSIATGDDRGKRMFMVAVELLQNINRHGIEVDGVKDGLFILGEKDGCFTVSASNLMRKDDVEGLEQSILKLKNMSKEERNAYYKQALRAHIGSQNSSTGVGLIDVARLSDGAMEFDFHDENEHVFYTLQITI